MATATGPTLGRVRAAVSIAADELGLRPLIDIDPAERAAQGLRVAAVIPTIVAALHRVSLGQDPLDEATRAGADRGLPARRDRARRRPTSAARALEQYLILTIDHGFNASTFTGRVVASTGADMADVVGAALGALAGPLHGGAPSRALDALDAIGDPAAHRGVGRGRGRRRPAHHGLRPRRLPHAATRARRCCGRSPPASAATSSSRPSTSRRASSTRCAASSRTARCRATSSSSPAS